MLKWGAEIAYVDNGMRGKVTRDGTFWRFQVLGEPMPSGQRIRYLIRDVDWKLTTAEMVAVGEWIDSGLDYHRMHLMPACISPLAAYIMGGSHVGAGPFADIKARMQHFPYRYAYGDDEMFLRDRVWPIMQASGRVLTHIGNRGWKFRIGNPYKDSCEEPTYQFCKRVIRRGKQEGTLPQTLVNRCEDRRLPKGLNFPVFDLAYNTPFAQMTRKVPEAFAFAKLKEEEANARVTTAIHALSANFHK